VFEENCKFEPLIQKINQARKNIKTVSDVMEIASRYSEANKTKDVSNEETDDKKDGSHKSGGRHENRNVHN
jgi:hypothetical protein